MKITIITSYYPPEQGAAANRIEMMANGFRERGFQVQVISPLPNYPDGRIKAPYRSKLYVKEEINGVMVWRLPLWPSNSAKGVLRMISMFSFAIPAALMLPFLSWRSQTLLIQCPPLPIAMLSALVSRVLRKKVIVNVSDLWPLSAYEMGVMSKGFVYKAMDAMARVIYLCAHKITGQSREIIDYVSEHYVQVPTFLYRNLQSGISFQSKGHYNGSVIYAGLIGHAQRISDIVCSCNFSLPFHIYGNGGDLEVLLSELGKKEDHRVSYNGSVSPKELEKVYPEFSYSLIPLMVRIYGAVPSKLFDSISRGVPVIFMGGGEGAEIVARHELGYVVEPGDTESLDRVLKQMNEADYLRHYKNCLSYSAGHLCFDTQFDELVEFVK